MLNESVVMYLYVYGKSKLYIQMIISQSFNDSDECIHEWHSLYLIWKYSSKNCDPLVDQWITTSIWKNVDLLSTFGWAYTKIGTIQRRLAWPLRKDDTQNREAFHIFCNRFILWKVRKVLISTWSIIWCPQNHIWCHSMNYS